MSICPQITVVCGSGGVGKTTVSAALALAAARSGQKTIVMTVDPAKRLADALGLTGPLDELREVAIGKSKNGGSLLALMLDSAKTFDNLVTRYASSPEARNRILKNKLYQHLSGMVAGTQEYMAIERLSELAASANADHIVLDTPPMQNARDFLTAPKRLAAFVGRSALRFLAKSGKIAGRAGLSFDSFKILPILNFLDDFAGVEFLRELAELVGAFHEFLDGFEERAKTVQALLKAKSTNFVLVGAPDERSFAEAVSFAERLREEEFLFAATILNRVFPGAEREDLPNFKHDELSLINLVGSHSQKALIENYAYWLPLIVREQKIVGKFYKEFGKNKIITLPLCGEDIHDLEGIEDLASKLKNALPQ